MILLFSIMNDHSTSKVMDWLLAFGEKKVERINSKRLPEANHFSGILETRRKPELRYKGSPIKSIWFRKTINFHFEEGKDAIDVEKLRSHLGDEIASFNTSLYFLCQASLPFILGRNYSERTLDVNKIKSLKAAMDCGLRIPPTLITNAKAEIASFIDRHGTVIVKSLSDPAFFNINGNKYALYTNILEPSDLNELSTFIFPSLIQKKIEKRFEIRAFYLCGKLFSAAIFSQTDTRTALDFRHYNYDKPNRIIPYTLGADMEKKIAAFMKRMNLNTGSLDFIMEPSGQYVFLEVNPVGQFDMLSVACNYPLEKEIAYLLSNPHPSNT